MITPALLDGKTVQRDFLYWELHEWNFIQALRMGDWKAVRNVAAQNPEIVRKVEEIMTREHVKVPLWPDSPPKAAK